MPSHWFVAWLGMLQARWGSHAEGWGYGVSEKRFSEVLHAACQARVSVTVSYTHLRAHETSAHL
eukprot:13070758-Alexandrium_andersonii.AAC.1